MRVSELERGVVTDPRLSTLTAMALALGCGVADLLAGLPGAGKQGQR
jgi:hypothetical protein